MRNRQSSVRPFQSALLLLLTLLIPSMLLGGRGTPAWATGQVVSHGAFTDRDGVKHEWYINAAHTLIWDDKPFVPVGGRFQARSWVPQPTEADFQADVEALKTLKTNRITDIYLQPARGGITTVPPGAIQRLIDHLEQEGFTYGISFNDGPQEILSGYDVRPGKYRNVVPADGGNIRFPIDTLTSALYFLVSENGQEVITVGEATMVAEGARVTTSAMSGKYVVFLLPRKAFFSSTSIGIPNLWEGVDNYRDALLLLFRQVKFGKGFRFFVDPLPADMHLSDMFDSFIPTGTAFATEWGEWLARRYKSVDGLQVSWGLPDRPLRDFREAALVLPLWGGSKGVEFLYNPVNGERYRVQTTRSTFWRDLTEFKHEFIRTTMNDLATVLKRTVANVPVVYRGSGYSALFTNLPAGQGFDGIGIAAYGKGSDLVTHSAGYLYAHSAESPKTMWLPVVGTADAPRKEKTSAGFLSRNALHSNLDWLRDIGARGFYVDGVRLTDPQEKAFDLSLMPEQLRWVADYADVLATTGVAGLERLPTALFYPRSLGIETASLRPLNGGGWWLPSDRPGIAYNFGPSGKAYALSDPDGSVAYYLWNPAGTRTIRLRIPKAATAPDAPVVRWSASAEGKVKGNVVTLTIGQDPIRLENFPTIPVPLDAFKEVTEEIGTMIGMMKKQETLDWGRYELQLSGLKRRYNEDTPLFGLEEALQLHDQLQNQLRAYAWLEAERATSHSFDTISLKYGASENRVLSVEPRLSGAPIASAFFPIVVRSTGTFNIWVAASPDASFSFRVDGKPLLDEAIAPQRIGATYAGGKLVWFRYGSATLPRGNHQIEIRANGAALLDTVLFLTGDFTPNGTVPPSVIPKP